MHITVWKYAEKQDKEANYMRRRLRKILALTTAIAVVAGVLPLDGGALSSKITNGGLTVSAAEFTSPETGNGVTPEEDPEVTFSDNDASVESAETLFTDNDTADNEGALQDGEEEITVQSVQNLIDALPSQEEVSEMSFEEQEKVYEKLQNAYEAYETLTEEEKAQLTGTDAFDELFDYFNGMVSAAGNVGSNGLTVTQSNGNADFYVYDGDNHTLTINKNTGDKTITISGTTTVDHIVVKGDNTVNIILDNVNIQQSSSWTSAFLIETGAIVNLTLKGKNVLQSGMTCAGLQVEGTLNIIGGENGSLQARGGNNGAGIGGGQNQAVGNIRINGGTVTAIGGNNGAGIGGGAYKAGGDISITGGTVRANAGCSSTNNGGGGTGIGAGDEYNPKPGTNADSIVINGGIVTANSFSSDVADIGNSNTTFSTTITANGSPVLGSAVITCKTGGIKYSSVSGDLQCIINDKGNSTVYGNMTLNTDLTIQKNYMMTILSGNSLIISNGVTLTNSGTISGNGTIDLSGGGSITGNAVESGVTLKCKVNRTGSKNILVAGESVAEILGNYSITLSANDGYDLPDGISVEIAGKQIDPDKYTYNKSSNPAKLTIPRALITGNIEIEVKAMYEIELTSADSETGLTVLDFGKETYGYSSTPAKKVITVTNIGKQEVEVGLPSSDNYGFNFAWISGSNGNTCLQPGNSASFSVQPKKELNAGTYNENITVSAVSGNNSVRDSFTAKFAVTRKQLDLPEILTWSSSTPGKATVTWKSVDNASGYGVQLYKDGNAVDVNPNESEYTGIFNIAGKGSYKVKVKAKGVGNYADSVEQTSSSLQFYSVDFNTDNEQKLSPQFVVEGGKVLDPLTGGNVLTKNGYTFAGWYSDSNFAENSKWDFDNSTVQNHTTLYARWYLVPVYSYYTITASAGTGGTITPSGSCSIREWLDKTFTITPDSGYEIADVLVDGKSVGAQSSYTFEDVRSNHTISASFLKIVPQEYPDGTKAKPDGSFETPDGTVILPDGTIVLPDGIRIEPDEEGNRPVIDKDNVVTAPDGTVYKPDGTIHNTDGSVQDHAGTYLSPAKTWIDSVNAVGNKITILLTGEAAGAIGYDYVIGTSADMLRTKEYYKISKNQLDTDTLMQYVEKGTYYAACHAWIRGADGKKLFGPWSELKEFQVDAVTPETPKIKNVKVSKQTVTVTYTVCSDAEGYDIVLGKEYKKVNEEKRPVNYGTLVKKVKNGNTVTVTFRNVTPGTYYAGLHSWNRTSEDGKKVFSPWSGVKKVVVK